MLGEEEACCRRAKSSLERERLDGTRGSATPRTVEWAHIHSLLVSGTGGSERREKSGSESCSPMLFHA